MDPLNLMRFLAGHLLAVGAAGLFAALLMLALNGLLLAVFGDRFYRRVALLLQGLLIAAFVMLMLLFPVLSGVVPVILRSGGTWAQWSPPFWFLGLYQRLLEGPSVLPIYTTLAQKAVLATLAVAALSVLTYPLAYMRKTRELFEGPGAHLARPLFRPANFVFHSTILRAAISRGVFHFISQTLPRVTRYRIYLVLYGGVGLSVVTASIVRFSSVHQQVRLSISPDGIRAALAIIVFWVVAGLRMTFVASGNQRGRWIFRMISGNPPHLGAAIEQSRATHLWVLLCTTLFTLAAGGILILIAPPALRSGTAIASQALYAAGMCLVLTDAFFLHVTAVPFTGESPREQPNLALTVLKYFTFFPIVAALPLRIEPWTELRPSHFFIAVAVFGGCHWFLQRKHQSVLREYSNQLALEEDEEDFPMKLGLRY